MNLQGINTTAGIHQDSLRAWQPRQPLHKSLLALPTLFFFLIKGITNFLILRVTFNDLERIKSCLKLYSHYKQAVNFKLLVKLAVTPREQRHREEAQQNLCPFAGVLQRISEYGRWSEPPWFWRSLPHFLDRWLSGHAEPLEAWYMCWTAILARTPLSLAYKIVSFFAFSAHRAGIHPPKLGLPVKMVPQSLTQLPNSPDSSPQL